MSWAPCMHHATSLSRIAFCLPTFRNTVSAASYWTRHVQQVYHIRFPPHQLTYTEASTPVTYHAGSVVGPCQPSSSPHFNGQPAKPSTLAKNKRLPATMITPSGAIEPTKKKGKAGQVSRKKKVRAEKGRERAIEVERRTEMRVREREERKVSRCGVSITLNKPGDRG